LGFIDFLGKGGIVEAQFHFAFIFKKLQLNFGVGILPIINRLPAFKLQGCARRSVFLGNVLFELLEYVDRGHVDISGKKFTTVKPVDNIRHIHAEEGVRFVGICVVADIKFFVNFTLMEPKPH